ncbi:MAG: hypothetical protein U0Q12_12080 [Vicinamibacterales bacterium]
MWSVEWDGGFVVGGDDNRKLTPNFRLKEFRHPGGTVRVHRELVSALQMLRERMGRTIAIRATDPDGLGATIGADDVDGLLKAADSLEAHKLFTEAAQRGDLVHVRIPDPARMPAIALEQALEAAFSVTSAFETAGDRFEQVTGNFDDAGLSFGPVQWNFGSGTLVPLFDKFAAADEAALRGCFRDPADYAEWTHVLRSPVREQIRWANDISAGRGRQDVVEPWKGYLQAVGRVRRFRAIMVEEALRMYGGKVVDAVRYLERLAPHIQIDHLRCVCSLYDLAIQQSSLDKAHAEIEARVREHPPRDQFELVRVAVEERGRKAAAPWRADCVSRRVGILNGVPETVDGVQRANLNFYMLRDVRISGARDALASDVTPQLARVADALAGGESLLA